MKLTSLRGQKRILLTAATFILTPVLLASCGGETTVIEETTVVESKAAPEENKAAPEENKAAPEENKAAPEENKAAPEPVPSPTPTPTPTPTPVPPPSPLPLTQVDCEIGAFGALSCKNTAGEPFSCSGNSSGYSCTGPGGGADTYGCNVVEFRAGGFTLSCTRLLQ